MTHRLAMLLLVVVPTACAPPVAIEYRFAAPKEIVAKACACGLPRCHAVTGLAVSTPAGCTAWVPRGVGKGHIRADVERNCRATAHNATLIFDKYNAHTTYNIHK